MPALTVKELLSILNDAVKKGYIKLSDGVYISSDAEGNKISPTTVESFNAEENKIVIYPA